MPALDFKYFYERAATCRALAMSVDGVMEPKTRMILREKAKEYEETAAELKMLSEVGERSYRKAG